MNEFNFFKEAAEKEKYRKDSAAYKSYDILKKAGEIATGMNKTNTYITTTYCCEEQKKQHTNKKSLLIKAPSSCAFCGSTNIYQILYEQN